MKKDLLAGAVIVGALVFATLCGAPVHAQTAPVTKPLSVKIGGFWPVYGSARFNGGSTQLSAGIDYALTKSTSANPSIPSIYADWNGGNRHGGRVDAYGIGIADRVYATTSGGGSGWTPYLGAGIGAYDSDIHGAFGGPSANKWGLGGKIFLGEEMRSGFFVEANYQILPSARGVNPSGFGVQVGYRF